MNLYKIAGELTKRSFLRGLLWIFLSQYFLFVVMSLEGDSLALLLSLLLSFLLIGKGAITIAHKEGWREAFFVGYGGLVLFLLAYISLSLLASLLGILLPFLPLLLGPVVAILSLAFFLFGLGRLAAAGGSLKERLKAAVRLSKEGFYLSLLMAFFSYLIMSYISLNPGGNAYLSGVLLIAADSLFRSVGILGGASTVDRDGE